MRHGIVVALAMVVLGGSLAGCGGGKDGASTTSKGKSGAAGPGKKDVKLALTAEELTKAFSGDPEGSATSYKDKTIEVEGKIEDVNTSKGKITLSGVPKMLVMCELKPTEIETALRKLEVGQIIKVKGVFESVVEESSVNLAHATFTEVTPSTLMTISAKDLAAKVLADKEAAAEQLDRWLVVTGKVLETTNDRGSLVAVLEGADKLTVSCSLEEPDWKDLKKDQEVSIRGRCFPRASDTTVVISAGYLIKGK